MAQQIITEQGAFTADVADKINDNFTDLYGSSVLHQASVTLTDAQIKATLGGSSLFEIVAAPGVGKAYVPMRAVAVAALVVGYTNIDGTDSALDIRVGSALLSSIVLNAQFAVMFQAAETRMAVFTAEANAASTNLTSQSLELTQLENQALNLELYNNLGAFTGGNAANTLLVSVAYLVVDVTTGLFS